LPNFARYISTENREITMPTTIIRNSQLYRLWYSTAIRMREKRKRAKMP
jgi:hypothetical protein